MNYTNHPHQKSGAFRLVAASFALAFALGQTAASAQSFVIQPADEAASKDTKIYSGVPTGNFSSNLSITSADIGAHFLSLVQFDLSSVTASAANVTSATLRLYSTGLGASGGPAVGGTVTLQPILSPWSEDAASTNPPGATYNAFFGSPATITAGSGVSSQNVTAGGFITWDLTDTVKMWLNGSLTNNGVLISLSTGGGDIGFADVDSNPAVAGSAPQLTINAVPEPSTTVAALAGLGVLSIVIRCRRLAIT